MIILSEDQQITLAKYNQHRIYLLLQGKLYDDLMAGTLSLETLQDSHIVEKIAQQLVQGNDAMQYKRTAKLWRLYLEIVEILLSFIKSDMTGNWQVHLKMDQAMLPFLVQNLQETHPEVYRHFGEGYHVIRRSDRYRVGLSTDMIIVQVLMRSFKTTGGLTRRSGTTELQRLVWLLSTPACAQVNCAMQKLTEVKYTTSDQHKDVSKARQDRYMADTLEVLVYLTPRGPFGRNLTLHSIVSGITADATVNCNCAQQVGGKVLEGMVGNPTAPHTSKKKAQVCPPQQQQYHQCYRRSHSY